MIDLSYFKFRMCEKVGGLGETPEIALLVTVFIIIFLYLYFFFLYFHFSIFHFIIYYTTGITIQVIFAVLSLQTKWRRSVWYTRCT
jgi:hypothetical protein